MQVCWPGPELRELERSRPARLLLEAYGFSVIGTVVFWGMIASFVLAALMAMLVGLGFWHAARTSGEEQLLTSAKAIAVS